MKIALITEKYPPDIGGLAISVERLARSLLAAGHQSEVFAPTTSQEPGSEKRSERYGIHIHRIGERRRTDDTMADWFDLITRKHRQERFDLLHAYFVTRSGFVAAYAGNYLGIPTVVSARGNDLDRAVFDPGKAVHTLYALQNASAVTANTYELVRKAQALAPGCIVTCIPNGVDGSHFQPMSPDQSLVHQLGLGHESVIGFVGEARAKKGIASALLAFREVVGQRPATFLLVGGVRSGEDQDIVRVFSRQNPQLRLIIIPYVSWEVLPAYYSLVDVLVMPSLRDGLPNALLEGMACGRAVVATPVGGISEVLRDGENGRLVPSGDYQALAAAILELLGDADLRHRFGCQARATVLRYFSLTQELEGNLAIYRQFIK